MVPELPDGGYADAARRRLTVLSWARMVADTAAGAATKVEIWVQPVVIYAITKPCITSDDPCNGTEE